MRTRELWREAARNFAAGASHGVVSVLAFVTLVLVLGTVSARAVVGVAHDAATFRDAGASVYRLDSPGNIDGAACDKLATVAGIDGAGATRAGTAVRFALLPGLPVPSFAATPGMTELLGARPTLAGAGLIVDDTLATSLAITTLPATTYLTHQASPVQVAGTYAHPDDGRDATIADAVLGVTVQDEPFDSCWARFWPPTDNPLDILGTTTISERSTGNEIVQWNPALGRTLDPNAAFHDLPLRAITGAAAAVAAVLAYVSARLRRLERAAARHVGVRRASLVGQALAETTIWLVPALALSLTVLWFTATTHNPDPPAPAWTAAARVATAAAAAWILTSALAAGATQERHLVRYFQQR